MILFYRYHVSTMRILVTGAGGYIGSTLVPLLLELGYDVIALDRFYFGEDKLPHDNSQLKLLKADIRTVTKQELTQFGQIDATIDLAALSNDPIGEMDSTLTNSINHLGRMRICSLSKSLGVKQYILPSSCSIYGFQDYIVDETSKVNPLTTYALANYKAELDTLALADDSYCVTVIRQATVYGYSRRMRFDLAINGMVRAFYKDGTVKIMRDGSQWRPFIHVKDTSSIMAKLLEWDDKDMINRETFNAGFDEQNYQIFDLAKRVAVGIGVDFNYEWYGDPDIRSYRVSFQKIKKVLNISPLMNAEKGAKEIWEKLESKELDPDDPQFITIQWYKKLIQNGETL